MASQKQNIVTRFFLYIWSLFLTGLIAILPLTLTIALFSVSFRILRSWLEPLKQFRPPFIEALPYDEFIFAIIIIIVAGTLYNIFILRPIIHAIENLFFKIPLVRPVYTGIKKLVEAFGFQDKITFKKVVLVEFPRHGVYSIGFLTSELSPELAPDKTKKFFNIFIPTTPNPTSGFLVVVPEESLIKININPQEAMAMVISGGIINPEIMKEELHKST